MKRALLLLVLLIACKKEEATPAPAASASAAVSASAPAPVVSAPAGVGSAKPGTATTYAGTYKTAAKSYYIADTKDFSNVKQVKDDPSKHLGAGNITVSVDAAGRVTGEIESGPASPGLLEGSTVGERIQGSVRRKESGDNGLTGTLTAAVKGDTLEGTMQLSESNASIVREGTFSLKKK